MMVRRWRALFTKFRREIAEIPATVGRAEVGQPAN